METRNYGYAGLAITLPKVLDCVGARLTPDLIASDKQAETVAKTLLDLTEGIYSIGRSLRSGGRLVRIRNRITNNEKYYDAEKVVWWVRSKIEDLFQHACIIGQDTLSLLETMWVHTHRVTAEEPDDLACNLAGTTHRSVVVDALD